MVTKIVQEPTKKTSGAAREINERAERGRRLYLTSRQLITKVDTDTYEVPSCTTQKIYTVRYGAAVEDCTCTDYRVHRGEVACKHLTAVALLFATRRRHQGVRQVSCSCLGNLGYHYIGYMAVDDDGEEVEAFHAVPCKRCRA